MERQNASLIPYMIGAQKMMALDVEGGISSYSLDELPHDVPTRMWGYFGLYPEFLGNVDGFLGFATDEKEDYTATTRKVIGLSLPRRIRRLDMVFDPGLRFMYENICAAANMPSMLVAVGTTVHDPQQTVTLFSIIGITPQEALYTIQARLRLAQARNN